jgi:hypothetical protein
MKTKPGAKKTDGRLESSEDWQHQLPVSDLRNARRAAARKLRPFYVQQVSQRECDADSTHFTPFAFLTPSTLNAFPLPPVSATG